MSSLGVVSDNLFSLESTEEWDDSAFFCGQESPDPESLVRRHGEDHIQPHIGWPGGFPGGFPGCQGPPVQIPYVEHHAEMYNDM